jgi:hypothetical protein
MNMAGGDERQEVFYRELQLLGDICQVGILRLRYYQAAKE